MTMLEDMLYFPIQAAIAIFNALDSAMIDEYSLLDIFIALAVFGLIIYWVFDMIDIEVDPSDDEDE